MTKIGKLNYKDNDYTMVRLQIDGRVASITLDNPPVNALSGKLIKELWQLLNDLSTDKNIKVIVFDSLNPDFFIAHVDINILEEQAILEELYKV